MWTMRRWHLRFAALFGSLLIGLADVIGALAGKPDIWIITIVSLLFFNSFMAFLYYIYFGRRRRLYLRAYRIEEATHYDEPECFHTEGEYGE